MNYAELSEAQAKRSRQFAEAQTDVMSIYCDAQRDLKDLQADNAKLRELMRELYEDQCADGDQWKYRDRMRELGVEVDA